MLKKELVQLGVTGVLVIVLIFALGNAAKKTSMRKSKNVSSKAKAVAAVLASSAEKPVNKGLYDLLEQQAQLIELKRDPFTAAPIFSERTLQAGVDLTGILWDKDRPLAIIDGEIVKKGAYVGDKTIVDIKKDRVILSDGKILTELKLKQ